MASRKATAYKSKVTNAVAEIKEDLGMRRYSFGDKNRLPNDLIRTVQDSGTAMLCISRLKSFIQGDGFVDPAAANFRVNKYQVGDELLDHISTYSAYFRGFYANVLFDLSGKVGSVYHVPVEKLRRYDNDTLVYNPRWGESNYRTADDLVYQPYGRSVTPAERLARLRYELEKHGCQLGEIDLIMDYQAGYLRDKYPIPGYYAGIDDIRSDAGISRLDNNNIKKGWRANVIISMPGELDDQTEDTDGKTEKDYFDDSVNDFMGEDGSSVLVLWGKTKELAPDVKILSLADILNATDKASDRIAKKVCRHMEVPPVLVGLTTPGQLGNTQEIVNSLKIFNSVVLREQNRITRAMSRYFPGIDWTISTLNILDYLPDYVVKAMTQDEIRAIGGLKPLKEVQEGGNNA